MLVSTTIIESGLDIPQANTLIVERADRLGLAQLYQIRGRVGRSRERAYAYLLYPSAAALSGEAAARLSTLSDYTELGSGFKIAMRDLEIRGAGNLLGDEQSGHVAAVGFELYCQMLDEAVQQLAGEADGRRAPRRRWEPVRLDVPVDAYIPADYIPYEVAKIDVHRRIAGRPRAGGAGARSPRSWRTASARCRSRSRTWSGSRRRASSSAGRAPAASSSAPGRLVDRARSRSTSARCGRSASELPEALYESLKKTLQGPPSPTSPRSASPPSCERPTRCCCRQATEVRPLA